MEHAPGEAVEVGVVVVVPRDQFAVELHARIRGQATHL
jgi:hypothetical protein